ncbi:hypothetical protein BFR38_00890 [Brochothrix thermosphacta]|uniref:zinc ribbon domain-containing protein n=1 Tax=Brochothrix thermosphacta TaxID=2756 RepID=UPI00083F86BD|nr:zinc ribbon domain-containing protein [Brochothrix thermosphacta]ODJ56506.1 hypothetical protein BFR38_00890 [Brochothrix thermosphacta]ODJ57945.1 hypothetical protein BFR42_04320 [Brochothrix thermosphacta]
MFFCSECGNELTEGAKFCTECGNKVEPVIGAKLSSEEFIKNKLLASKEPGISAVPDIPEKKLITLLKVFSAEINPAKVIAIVDTSNFSNGKAGMVFTGTEAYVKEAFNTVEKIPYEGIDFVEYDLEQELLDNGKVKEKKKIIINYQAEAREIYTETSYPLNILADILQGIKDNVETLDSNNQIVQLQNLDPVIIELYFRVIIVYLKLNDGIIDKNEYKELISLMASLKLSKIVADKLRDYRFSESNEDLDVLLIELREQLTLHQISANAIYQSLGMNIIAMNLKVLDNWQSEESLVYMLGRLGITDKQVEFTIKKINLDRKIIEERMNDGQIRSMLTEFSALAAGAGISIGALAITGAVSGFGGVSGGLIALGLGTGGIFIGAAAVAAGAYGVYRGIKFMAGTSEVEKFGIRMSALTKKMEILRASNVYIIEDITYLNEKTSHLFNEIITGEALKQELIENIQHLLMKSKNISDSSKLVEEEQVYSEKELIITQLPKILNESKFVELNKESVQQIDNLEVIYNTYKVKSADEGIETNLSVDDTDVVEAQKMYLDENIDSTTLAETLQILQNIGYFNTTTSSIAQGKVVAKKGIESLKKGLFGKGE